MAICHTIVTRCLGNQMISRNLCSSAISNVMTCNNVNERMEVIENNSLRGKDRQRGMVTEGFLKEETFDLRFDSLHQLDKEKRLFPVEGPAWATFGGTELARLGGRANNVVCLECRADWR